MSNARFSFHKEVIGWWDLCNEAKKNFWVFFRGCLKTIKKSSKIPCFWKISIGNKFFHDEFLKREFGILQKREFGILQKREFGILQKREFGILQKREFGILQKREFGILQKREFGILQKREFGIL